MGDGTDGRGAVIIKTNCQGCGKKKAIKNKVIFIPGDAIVKTVHGCHKCGWVPSTGQGVKGL
jgi:hypothetical protein